MSEPVKDETLRAVVQGRYPLTTLGMQCVATELIAARRELAELNEECAEHDSAIVRRDIEAATLRAQVAEMESKLAEFQPRPLREGDEWCYRGEARIREINPLHLDSMASYDIDRVIRVPWHVPAAAPESAPAPRMEAKHTLSPTTSALVDRFAEALREKLAAAEAKYGFYEGWMAGDWMDECRAKLRAHVEKGDPRDVAAFCAFLWHHGEPTVKPESAPVEKAEKIPRWKRGDRVVHDRFGLGKVEAQTDDLAAFVRFDVQGAWPSPCHYVKPGDLAPAPPPEPPAEGAGEKNHTWLQPIIVNLDETATHKRALRSIVENSSEVDTVRRAALALLGGEQ